MSTFKDFIKQRIKALDEEGTPLSGSGLGALVDKYILSTIKQTLVTEPDKVGLLGFVTWLVWEYQIIKKGLPYKPTINELVSGRLKILHLNPDMGQLENGEVVHIFIIGYVCINETYAYTKVGLSYKVTGSDKFMPPLPADTYVPRAKASFAFVPIKGKTDFNYLTKFIGIDGHTVPSARIKGNGIDETGKEVTVSVPWLFQPITVQHKDNLVRGIVFNTVTNKWEAMTNPVPVLYGNLNWRGNGVTISWSGPFMKYFPMDTTIDLSTLTIPINQEGYNTIYTPFKNLIFKDGVVLTPCPLNYLVTGAGVVKVDNILFLIITTFTKVAIGTFKFKVFSKPLLSPPTDRIYDPQNDPKNTYWQESYSANLPGVPSVGWNFDSGCKKAIHIEYGRIQKMEIIFQIIDELLMSSPTISSIPMGSGSRHTDFVYNTAYSGVTDPIPSNTSDQGGCKLLTKGSSEVIKYDNTYKRMTLRVNGMYIDSYSGVIAEDNDTQIKVEYASTESFNTVHTLDEYTSYAVALYDAPAPEVLSLEIVVGTNKVNSGIVRGGKPGCDIKYNWTSSCGIFHFPDNQHQPDRFGVPGDWSPDGCCLGTDGYTVTFTVSRQVTQGSKEDEAHTITETVSKIVHVKNETPLQIVTPHEYDQLATHGSASAIGGNPPYKWSISRGTIDPDTGQYNATSQCGEGNITVTDKCGTSTFIPVLMPDGHWVQVPDNGCFSSMEYKYLWFGCGSCPGSHASSEGCHCENGSPKLGNISYIESRYLSIWDGKSHREEIHLVAGSWWKYVVATVIVARFRNGAWEEYQWPEGDIAGILDSWQSFDCYLGNCVPAKWVAFKCRCPLELNWHCL